jgi:plasmid stability protein
MAQILVRGISDTAKDRLKRHAARNKRSVEAEVRALIEALPEPATSTSHTDAVNRVLADIAAHPVDDESWAQFEAGMKEAREVLSTGWGRRRK